MASFREIFERAQAAGRQAGEACRPSPMVIAAVDICGRQIGPASVVSEGPCGFAGVRIRPGNSAFARWLLQSGLARKAYGGGVYVSVHEYGQSYERKSAHAYAMAESLREQGIERAYSESRLD